MHKHTRTYSHQGDVFGEHLPPNPDLKANQLQLTSIFSPQVQMSGSYHRNSLRASERVSIILCRDMTSSILSSSLGSLLEHTLFEGS